MNKPVAQSCLQNQSVILEQIKRFFVATGSVLEIGSGTGQHAVHFANACPQLSWTPSDVAQHLPSMQMWFDEAKLDNIQPSIAFDVTQSSQQPAQIFNYMFTANTLHIMSWAEVQQLFEFVGKQLKANGYFMVYGPFNYNGHYTSESNKNFDVWLSQLAGDSCIKDFEAIEQLAGNNGLTLVDDVEMPANNRVLVWQKTSLI